MAVPVPAQQNLPELFGLMGGATDLHAPWMYAWTYTPYGMPGNHDLGASWISHKDLSRVGKIRIDLSAAPTAWGTQPAPPKLLDAG